MAPGLACLDIPGTISDCFFLSFAVFLVWPFVEGYWLAAVSLLSLAPPPPEGVSSNTIPWFSAKDFEKRAQLFGKTLYSQVRWEALYFDKRARADTGCFLACQGDLSYLEVSCESQHYQYAATLTGTSTIFFS